jgi:lysozyme family protein
MSNFKPAVDALLPREGGYSDYVQDQPTNFGITLTFYQSIYPDATKDDIKNLSIDVAIKLYQEYFWDDTKFALINSQNIVNSLFDAAVNLGIAQAIKLLQRAANQLQNQLIVDGVLGPNSLKLINELNASALLEMFRVERADFYKALVYVKPRKQMFLKGWLNRAASA